MSFHSTENKITICFFAKTLSEEIAVKAKEILRKKYKKCNLKLSLKQKIKKKKDGDG